MIPSLSPAYGRDYRSATRARDDFLSDLDFILEDPLSVWDGKPVTRQQLYADGYTKVRLRFAGLRRCLIVEVK